MKLPILDRKLVRDLWNMKAQATAIALVVACGITSFVMATTTLTSLQENMDSYYARYRFAHVFTSLERAPRSLVDRVRMVPGVAAVEARVVADVTLNVPGMEEPAVGHFVGLPDRGSGLRLNRLHLRSGRLADPATPGEVVVGEVFAVAHGLQPGDVIRAVLNGRSRELRVVGIGLSPEFTFQIQPGSLLPDARRYCAFWVAERELEAAFDMDGAFNDLVVRLAPGASEGEVVRQIDVLTERYGGLGAYGRDQHVSHRYVSDELRQLKSMARIGPTIFLVVAGFLLHVVLSRLIATQREQIAVLKAFGYHDGEVARHYLRFALVIVVFGALVGIGAGAWLGMRLSEMYAKFYKFPSLTYSLYLAPVLLAVGISMATGAVGTLSAVRRALLLPPAEAMRPEPPTAFHRSVVDRFAFVRRLPSILRMVLRQVLRAPVRSALTVVGIALAGAQLIFGTFIEDSLAYLIDFEFARSQRYDVAVSFSEPLPLSALFEAKRQRGVVHAEPFRDVAARVSFLNRSRRLGLKGFGRERELLKILDRSGDEIPLPHGDGVLVSAKLAEVLGCKVGDTVRAEVLEGERPERELVVAALVEDFAGTSAYIELAALNRMMGEDSRVSGLYLRTDPAVPGLFRDLKGMPGVAAVNVKKAAVQNFRDTLSENILMMKFFNVLFAGIIAFGTVYNSARISFSERSRELATMQVIGFTRGETALLFFGEQAVLIFLAVPLGCILGTLFAYASAPAYSTEVYRLPIIVAANKYALSAVAIFVAAIFSGKLIAGRIYHLELTSILKSRD